MDISNIRFIDMKKAIITFLFIGYCISISFAQSTNGSGYTNRAQKFLSSFRQDSLQFFHFPFTDSLRGKWERVPGLRQGLKLSMFSEQQKILFHELLRSCLSTQGYLTATAVMFNEDIQKKFEPTLGRNEYWVEVFGEPSTGMFWGWKLEGHHL